MFQPPSIPVTDAAGASAADRLAIAAGTPSRALMQRAGAAAAAEIAARFSDRLADGVVVATGQGNNGGDGWVIASALHAVGIGVRVVECMHARTEDAVAERTFAVNQGVPVTTDVASLRTGGERIVVDALLGTGFIAGNALRGAIGEAVAALHSLAARGCAIVAIDVPTGLDASTGVHVGAPPCALTLTFGTVKRGQLVARQVCGAIAVLDIGLGGHADRASSASLATAAWFRSALPPITADAHKGTRKKIAIIGGAEGMAGAVILAARAALRSGAGMVKGVVASESLLALQEAEPAALSAQWPTDDEQFVSRISGWADAILIGPGLGKPHARAMVERALRCFAGPVVLDADALNAFEGDVDALVPLIGDRAALLTPHPAEFARLIGETVENVLLDRFDAPAVVALRSGASVLLKGVPTIVTSPGGNTIVVAEGTPVLATGGSGDILGGIAATLLAQTGNAQLAGALAAFAHGRAAATVSLREVRGFTLDDVLAALPSVWSLDVRVPRPPVLAELPQVGEPA
ncbi:MAG: NAD(P)H-hydrate dehydratase [bacterium]